MYADRKHYLNEIIPLMMNGRIKIITGIRRCGKSYMLKEIFMKYLKEHGAAEDHIIYIALDNPQNNDLLNPLELDRYIRNLIKDSDWYFVLLDEIQNVIPIVNPVLTDGKIVRAGKNEEDVISYLNIANGLSQISNVDLYITGSNSKFLSTDIMTQFRDRGDEVHLWPLSFSEYVEALDLKDISAAFNEYRMYGGMPLVLTHSTPERKEKYLKDLFKMTYFKDIVERNRIRKTEELETLTTIMADQIGNLTNPTTIANTFRSEMKINITVDTVSSYLNYLSEAFILSKVNRIDLKRRRRINGTCKYYFTDPGLRNARTDFLRIDDGFMMKNILYNELAMRGYSIEVGSMEVFEKNKENKTVRKTLETDFALTSGSKYYYIQSSFRLDASNEAHEREPLIKINDSFKKIIVVRDSGPVRRDKNGIAVIGVEQFLLDPESLDL